MKLIQHRYAAVAIVGALALGSAACSDTEPVTADDPAVVATTAIWADIATELTCGAIEVPSVVPPGVDPHSWEPSLQHREMLDEARLVIANGLGFEQGLIDTLHSVETAGTHVLYLGDHVEPHPFTGHDGLPDTDDYDADNAEGDSDHADDHGDDHGDDEQDHGSGADEHVHGDVDPHIWLDPNAMREGLPVITDALVAQDVVAGATAEQCLEAYDGELQALDAEIEAAVAAVPVEARKLVSNHASFAYFADRYNFEVIDSVIPAASTLGATSATHLAALVDLLEAEQVSVIFTARGESDNDAQAVANQIDGLEVVEVSIESPDQGQSYVDFMRQSAQEIIDALD